MMDADNKTNDVPLSFNFSKKTKRVRKNRNKKNKLPEIQPKFVTIDRPKNDETEENDILISLTTKQKQYAMPNSAISIPESYNATDLNKLLASMLSEGSFSGGIPEFDFLVEGAMCPGKLCHRIDSSVTLSREGVINIEYLERLPEPEHKDSLNHDDWVASLHYSENNYLLTGCYDNSLHIWTPTLLGKGKEIKLSCDKAAHKIKVSDAHKAPVKVVSWIPKSNRRFISGSMDQTVLLWEYQKASNTVRCVYRCKGHTQSLESLSVSADGALFATGSWEGALKIWTTNEQNVTDFDGQPKAKKQATTTELPKDKSPRVSLSEHTQSVSGLVWPTLCTLASCSWDNSVRLWDVDQERKTLQYVAPASCLAIDSSPFNNTLLITTADNHVRLLDSREADALVLSKTYQSHRRWASAVKWSPGNEYHFATAGFDKTSYLWDIRGARSPLWELTKHDDQILALEWSRFKPNTLFTGSADTNVHMYCL